MSETLIGLLHKSSSHSRPSQIAWAVVWGCICGLLPKTSLLFPACLAFSFILPIHLVTAGLCLLITSCCAPWLHPLLGSLGHWLLQDERIRQLSNSLDRIPLVPWLKLHNTVLLGSLSFSVVMAWPVYWMIHQILLRPYAHWLRLQNELQLAKQHSPQPVLINIQSAAQSLHETAATSKDKPPLVSPQVEPRPLASSLSEMAAAVSSLGAIGNRSAPDGSVESSLVEAIDSIHALEDLLEQATRDPDSQVDAKAVLARAAKASELVDEILLSLDSLADADAPGQQSTRPAFGNTDPASRLSVRIDAPQIYRSHDTKISIYRRARTGDTIVSGAEQSAQSEKDSMPTAAATTAVQADLAVVEPPQSSSVTIRTPTPVPTNTTSPVRHEVETRHEEALRHLLSHLRALKEKV